MANLYVEQPLNTGGTERAFCSYMHRSAQGYFVDPSTDCQFWTPTGCTLFAPHPCLLDQPDDPAWLIIEDSLAHHTQENPTDDNSLPV